MEKSPHTLTLEGRRGQTHSYVIFSRSIFYCFILLRNLDTKKLGAEVFGELLNVMLEENGEHKMVGEFN